MRITRQELHQIIQEELDTVLDEKKGKKRKAAKKKRRKKKKKKKAAKKDACYHKVKSRYKVWPSAYASGALVKCRNVGAKNWGNSKKESLHEEKEVKIDQDKIKQILKDEGGAAGLDPFLKEFGKENKEDIIKTLEDMPSVKKHEHGDYYLLEDLDEKQLTDRDEDQKEKFVKGMKKNMKGFKKDYGKDAKSVMYATATKMAQEKP